MLGGFEMNFEGTPVHLNMKGSSKPIQMLQLLLHAGEGGISRRALMEYLFGQEPENDAANSLNVTVSRLRKLLRESILPGESPIRVRIDRYFFECSYPLWIDTREVERLRTAADLSVGAERMSLLYQLGDLYRGSFLPELDGEE